MIIAWTYLLHAYFRSKGIEYRYYEMTGIKKKFHKTTHGAYKHWELERCLNERSCPLDHNTKNNLKFLIGLRHEIEHQMTTKIDDVLSSKFQACCLNYNDSLRELFGERIDHYLTFSLQLSSITEEQKDMLFDYPDIPQHIKSYISTYDNGLINEDFNHPKYAYRVIFTPKLVNHKGSADRVIEFVKSDSPMAEKLNKEYAVIKETEKRKLLPKQIVQIMKDEGFSRFNMHEHTQLWKNMDAKNLKYSYGGMVADQAWYWYESWLCVVRQHCIDNREIYQNEDRD